MSSLMMALASGSASYERYRVVAERSGGLRIRSLDQFLQLLAGRLARAMHALRAARCRRRMASDFRRMDDRLLADIGLTRVQAEALAEGLVAGRTACAESYSEDRREDGA